MACAEDLNMEYEIELYCWKQMVFDKNKRADLSSNLWRSARPKLTQELTALKQAGVGRSSHQLYFTFDSLSLVFANKCKCNEKYIKSWLRNVSREKVLNLKFARVK